LDIYFEYKKLTAGSPPGAPNIDGPTNGDSRDDILFVFSADDPDDDDVRFHIDWGDGQTEITDFVTSGGDKPETHSWIGNKDFTITVQAEDSSGLFGPEETHVISIPRAKAKIFELFDIFPNLFRILNFIFG
jgi:hypothetical protein